MALTLGEGRRLLVVSHTCVRAGRKSKHHSSRGACMSGRHVWVLKRCLVERAP